MTTLSKEQLIGMQVECQGRTVTIAQVNSASNYGRNGNDDWYIEFTDTTGQTRYWKQELDGGRLVRKTHATPEQVREAREYWGNLSDKELKEFYVHYTTGSGKGGFSGVDKYTSFDDYLVESALQTQFEIFHDC